MERTVLLSVVVPAHNSERTIATTLRSLLAQELPNLEVVVIDDGSTDGTVQVVNSLADRFDKIPIQVISQANGGVSMARNVGLTHAQGEYVLFLDADDLVAPELVARLWQCHLTSKRPPDVICWKYRHASEAGVSMNELDHTWSTTIPEESTGPDTLHRFLALGIQHIWTASAVYRRTLLLDHNVRFSEGCTYGEDVEFIGKAVSLAERVRWVDSTLSTYTARHDSLTKTATPRRYDSVEARIRLADFLDSAEDPQLKRLSQRVERQAVVRFLAASNQLLTNNWSSRQIAGLLRTRYPSLLPEVRERARHVVCAQRLSRSSWSWLAVAVSPRVALALLGLIRRRGTMVNRHHRGTQ